jgi:hypothetical protein
MNSVFSTAGDSIFEGSNGFFPQTGDLLMMERLRI